MTPKTYLSLLPPDEVDYQQTLYAIKAGTAIASPLLGIIRDEDSGLLRIYSHDGRERMMALSHLQPNVEIPVLIHCDTFSLEKEGSYQRFICEVREGLIPQHEEPDYIRSLREKAHRSTYLNQLREFQTGIQVKGPLFDRAFGPDDADGHPAWYDFREEARKAEPSVSP
jgi:hypothetical protein